MKMISKMRPYSMINLPWNRWWCWWWLLLISVVWVGDVLLLSEVVELFFICGRSKMSRTEKLDDRGILISNNLEIDKRKFIYQFNGINSCSSSTSSIINWDVICCDSGSFGHILNGSFWKRDAQYSKIRQKNSWNHIALALYTIEFFNGTCRSKNFTNT